MKLFLYEHITSGALCEQALPTSLAEEGELMLQAALHDALACDDLQIITLRDARLAQHPSSVDLKSDIIVDCNAFDLAWQQALEDADVVLIIAPESAGLLSKLNQQVLDKHKNLLGCQPSAVTLTTNKHQCSQILKQNGLATPVECLAHRWQANSFLAPHGFLVKPNKGVGCESTHYFDNAHQVITWLNQHTAEQLSNMLIQAYIPGLAASLTVLYTDTDCQLLSINEQHISQHNNTFRFTGCTVNGIDDNFFSKYAANNLAQQIQTAIPGLWGIIGIDFILNEKEPVIVDINPRLTTSYAGLSRSISLNPMQLIIDLKTNEMANLPQIKHLNAVKISI